MQMCFIFVLLLFILNSFTKEMPGGMNALAMLYFAKIQWLCTHDMRLWIWIYS